MITLVKVDQCFLVFDSGFFLSFIACGTSLPKPPFYLSIITSIIMQLECDDIVHEIIFNHQIYDTATGQRVLTLHDSNNTNNYSKNLASFNPTDDLVLNDGVLWDVKGKRVIHKFDKFNNFVSGVFHPSGLEIIINSEIASFSCFYRTSQCYTVKQ